MDEFGRTVPLIQSEEKRVRFNVLFMTLLLAVGPLLALPAPATDGEIVVPVRVYDRDKQPVTGLQAADFEVELEGDELSISEVVDLNSEAAAAQSRMYVLFFDLRFSNERGVMVSRDSALHFVQKVMRDQDRVAVYLGTANRGVLPLTDFTSDKRMLTAAITGLGMVKVPNAAIAPPQAMSSDVDAMMPGFLSGIDKETYFANGFSLVDPDAAPKTAASNAEARDDIGLETDEKFESRLRGKVKEMLNMAERQENRDAGTEVIGYVEGLRALARNVAKEPGAKNLMLFTGGFSNRYLVGGSSTDMVRDAQRSLTSTESISGNSMGDAALQSRVDDVLRELQGAGCMAYVMDTSAMEAGGNSRSNSQILNSLASDTGGHLFNNLNDFGEAMGKVTSYANEMYLVHGTPTSNLEKGALARMKVDVSQRRTKVTAPKYWLITDTVASSDGATDAAPADDSTPIADYISGAANANDLPMALKVTPIPERNGLVRLAVDVTLASDYFKGIEDDKLALEFHAMATNGDGTLDYKKGQYQLKFDQVEAEAEANGLRYVTALFVPAGDVNVRAVVRNPLSGAVATGETELTAPADMERVQVVMVAAETPPTLNDQRDDLVSDVDMDYPFTLGNNTFQPVDGMQADAAGEGRFFFAVGESIPANGKQPDVRALLREPGQQPTPLTADAMKVGYRRDAKASSVFQIYMILDFAKLGLEAGKTYELMTQFILADGKALRTITPFNL